MMILTKEATDKDRSIKSQLLVSSNNSDKKLRVREFGEARVTFLISDLN